MSDPQSSVDVCLIREGAIFFDVRPMMGPAGRRVGRCQDARMPKTLPALADTSPICCAPLGTTAALSEEDATSLAVRLKALADPVRLRMVAHLLAAPRCEACTCELAPVVGLTEATVSHHLASLLGAGLATKRREGLNVYYRLDCDALSAVARTLSPVGC